MKKLKTIWYLLTCKQWFIFTVHTGYAKSMFMYIDDITLEDMIVDVTAVLKEEEREPPNVPTNRVGLS